jgi:hypothetical protein
VVAGLWESIHERCAEYNDGEKCLEFHDCKCFTRVHVGGSLLLGWPAFRDNELLTRICVLVVRYVNTKSKRRRDL